MVEIVKIDTSKRSHVTRFINVHMQLYKNCPVWVPPLWSDARAQLNRKRNPFFEHSDADFFVAVKDGRDVGRIAVLEPRRHNEYRNERTAFFYLFDSIDDTEVSRALFGQAEEWAKSRGLNKMLGPKGFMALDAFGVLVEGFEHMPAMGVPYNYPYYDKLVTDMGYRKYTDVQSAWVSKEMDLDPRIYELAEKIKARRGLTIKRFRNKREMMAMVPAVVRAYNDMFVYNWEYIPVTDNEAKAIANRLRDILRPDLIKLAMKGDEVVGFLFAFPNIGEAIRKTGGHVWPFGFITLLRAIRTTKRVDLNGMGILPKYQGLGANAIMYVEMARTLKEGGFEFADLVQVEEKNEKMQAELKALGARFYKTHRVYVKEL